MLFAVARTGSSTAAQSLSDVGDLRGKCVTSDGLRLVTTLGPLAADDLGMILPHEHVFVALRTWDHPGYAEAVPADVIRLMGPEIDRARQVGITAIVEPSTV